MTRWLIPTLCFAILAASSGCKLNFTSNDGYQFDYEGPTELTSDAGEINSSIKNVRVINRFGNVDVATSQGEASPAWTWNAKVWGSDQEQAQAFADLLVVEVVTNGDTQTWTLLMPDASDDLRGVTSDFKLIVGTDVKVDVENRFGGVQIKGVAQDVKIKNAFGDFNLVDFGNANVEVQHGDGKVENGQGDLKATGSHGNLTIAKITGNVEAEGSHTNLILKDVTGNATLKTSFKKLIANGVKGNANLTNSHGEIAATVEGTVKLKNAHGDTKLTFGGNQIDAECRHGDIHVVVNNPSFNNVSIKNQHGDIQLNLPAGSVPAVAMKCRHGEAKSNVASDGASNQKVTLDTSHGDIDVN